MFSCFDDIIFCNLFLFFTTSSFFLSAFCFCEMRLCNGLCFCAMVIAKHLNRDLPSAFSGYFTYMANINNHNTRGALKKLVNVPYSKTSFYGTQSITAKSVKDWNNLQNKAVFEFHQEQVSIPKLISTLKKYFITSYSD